VNAPKKGVTAAMPEDPCYANNRIKRTFVSTGKTVSTFRDNLIDYLRLQSDPLIMKSYIPMFTDDIYHGIDLENILIRAFSDAEAVLKWRDYLNANAHTRFGFDFYVDLQTEYVENRVHGMSENKNIKNIVEFEFDADNDLWLLELKNRTVIL